MTVRSRLRTGVWSTLPAAALAALLAGCASEARMGAISGGSEMAAAPAMAGPGSADGVIQTAALEGQAPARSAPPGLPRKIIYTAEITLVVKDLGKAEAGLKALLARHGGFVASSDLSGTPGSPRSGNWTVRVPVDRFEEFKAGAIALGELQTTSTDSQDVTEEFYDVAARLKNKKVEEARLLRHLDRSTARLEDILAVEREISRVRGEIEQMEGRLRLLANQTELTTITVHLNEAHGYVPAERTTFMARVARTFGASTEGLVQFFATLALILVAMTPWVALLAVIGLPLWVWIRRRRSR